MYLCICIVKSLPSYALSANSSNLLPSPAFPMEEGGGGPRETLASLPLKGEAGENKVVGGGQEEACFSCLPAKLPSPSPYLLYSLLAWHGMVNLPKEETSEERGRKASLPVYSHLPTKCILHFCLLKEKNFCTAGACPSTWACLQYREQEQGTAGGRGRRGRKEEEGGRGRGRQTSMAWGGERKRLALWRWGITFKNSFPA